MGEKKYRRDLRITTLITGAFFIKYRFLDIKLGDFDSVGAGEIIGIIILKKFLVDQVLHGN